MSDKTTRPALWTRREAILKASALLGGTALVGQAAMLAGCGREETAAPAVGAEPRDGLFSERELELLAGMAETILPETATPGANAAGVGPFIALIVTDCYSPAEQRVFMDGLAAIDDACRETYGEDFVALAPAERLAIAERLDREQYDAMQASADGEPVHYFRMFKELTVVGFFTSEAAYTNVLEYVETPGRYETCRELGPDVRMHANHGASVSGV